MDRACVESDSARRLNIRRFFISKRLNYCGGCAACNPDIAGVMPFTILFYNWSDIKTFAEMKPKPVAEQAAVSFQPVLLSWECWTGQVYAGTKLKAFAHVVNDSANCRDIQNPMIQYWIEDESGNKRCQDNVAMKTVAYYEVEKTRVSVDLPEDLQTGTYQIGRTGFREQSGYQPQ